jgi:SAM-dependent methyltransferase
MAQKKGLIASVKELALLYIKDKEAAKKFFQRYYYLPLKYNQTAEFQLNEDGFFTRQYKDKNQYITHQQKKMGLIEDTLKRRFDERMNAFYQYRFRDVFEAKAPASVLCLGARDGVEVAALRKYNLLAVGIDIEYPKDSPYVHYGDFHNIPYPDGSFDFAYMNCFDHILDPKQVLAQVLRILKKPAGTFVLDLVSGDEDKTRVEKDLLKGTFESFVWQKRQQVVDLIQKHGFELTKTNEIAKVNEFNDDYVQYEFTAKAEVGAAR